MSRQLRRVPLDFDWPLNKTWDGFVNPHYATCPSCKGRGETTARQRVSDLVSLLLLSGADVQRGQCHPYFHADGLYNTAGQVPSADLLELTDRLAGREARSPFGYDSTARWEALKKIVAAVGLPDTWGECPACAGTGQDPSVRHAARAGGMDGHPLEAGWHLRPVAGVHRGAGLGTVTRDVRGRGWAVCGPDRGAGGAGLGAGGVDETLARRVARIRRGHATTGRRERPDGVRLRRNRGRGPDAA